MAIDPVGLGEKEISVHTSVTCTFGQNMYQEFDSARESRMVCGCGRALAWWEACGKEGQQQARGAALGSC